MKLHFLFAALAERAVSTSGIAANVAQIQTQGKVADQTRVNALFSADIVRLGETTAADPFAIDCAQIAGEGRWVDARTWSWQMSRPLQSGERCIFTLKPGLTAVGGDQLDGRSSFEFFGAPPRPWRTQPGAGASIEEDAAFAINPGAALDPATLAMSECAVYNPVGWFEIYVNDMP